MAIPKTNTELENYLVYGIDLKNRKIFFGCPLDWGVEDNGGFDQSTVELAVRAIKRMEGDHPSKPIEIHMNSYGGDAYALMYLIDAILSSKCQFKFFGGGAIMSAATWIMAVCDERNLYKNSVIMVHNGWAWMVGKHDDVQIDAEEDLRLRDQLIAIYEENSFMPKKFWEDILQRDLYLTAEETIKLGLADFIVPYPKRGNLRKRRDKHMTNPPHHKTIKALTKKIYNRVKLNLPSEELRIHVPKPTPSDDNVVVDNKPVYEFYEDSNLNEIEDNKCLTSEKTEEPNSQKELSQKPRES